MLHLPICSPDLSHYEMSNDKEDVVLSSYSPTSSRNWLLVLQSVKRWGDEHSSKRESFFQMWCLYWIWNRHIIFQKQWNISFSTADKLFWGFCISHHHFFFLFTFYTACQLFGKCSSSILSIKRLSQHALYLAEMLLMLTNHINMTVNQKTLIYTLLGSQIHESLAVPV